MGVKEDDKFELIFIDPETELKEEIIIEGENCISLSKNDDGEYFKVIQETLQNLPQDNLEIRYVNY